MSGNIMEEIFKTLIPDKGVEYKTNTLKLINTEKTNILKIVQK